MCRRYGSDSNPRPQDGKHRRNHEAMAATTLFPPSLSSLIYLEAIEASQLDSFN